MDTRSRPLVWILLSVALYLLALVLPALTARPPSFAAPTGTIAGYLSLGLGWLLLTHVTKGMTLLFALAWLGNIAWVMSLVALARGKRRQALVFAATALVLALLVVVPVVTAAPIFDGESELIYGIGPGYLFWLSAIAIPLVAAVVLRRPEAAPTAATGAA